MGKMGRPIKGSEPLTRQLVVRMTETMHNKVIDYAKNNKLEKTEVIRKALKELFNK